MGTVTHYFARPQVGIVKLSAAIKLGDTLRFRGHTADFQQEVASMEIEHAHAEAAASGAEVGDQSAGASTRRRSGLQG